MLWFGWHSRTRITRTDRLLLGALVLIALIYTTPWDNYLVATRVWWYDSELVTGLTLGWVPIEEYTFFLLQPLMTGFFTLWLARRTPPPPLSNQTSLRWGFFTTAALWLAAIVLLASAWSPGRYLGLELVWALPPLLLQFYLGGDRLAAQRQLVLPAILIPTAYLAAADWIAIGSGTWTIDPAQSLNIFLASHLPLEEVVFFLLTNSLVVCGLVLGRDPVMHARLSPILGKIQRTTGD